MAQYIKQGNIFGRIGTEIGKGLSESIPKEVERNRLSAGLKELEKQKDLTPFQQFSRLAAIPGVTPQMLQSGSDLLRQQARGQALGKQNEPKPSPFPKRETAPKGNESNVPSITKSQTLEDIQSGYQVPTQDEIFADAGRRYEENPALYNNDPNKAIEAAETDAARNEKRYESNLKQYENLSKIQDNVRNRLKEQSGNLNVQIPDDVYSDVEDQAIQATKPKKEGGGGLTEQQAIKEYGKKLNDISKNYKSLENVGSSDFIVKDKHDIKRNLKEIREGFKARNDLENLANKYISTTKLSPGKAFYLAYPPSEIKELNNEISRLPNAAASTSSKGNENLTFDQIDQKVRDDTLKASERLAKAMGKEGSPLAIAEELKAKGYDPSIWFDYLNKNRGKLDLSERQGRELGIPKTIVPPLNDTWLFLFSGLDKLVEK